MFHGPQWKLSHPPELFLIRRHALRRRLSVVGWLRIPVNNGIVWVLCDHRRVSRLLNMVCVFQLSWRRGKLTTCPLLLRHVKLLVKVVVLVPQEKAKRKCLTVHSKYLVNLKCLVPLSAPVNALWSMIQILLLLWQLNLSEEKRERVGEIEKLRQFSKEECHNCFVFRNYCTSFFASARLPWAILFSLSYCIYNS